MKLTIEIPKRFAEELVAAKKDNRIDCVKSTAQISVGLGLNSLKRINYDVDGQIADLLVRDDGCAEMWDAEM